METQTISVKELCPTDRVSRSAGRVLRDKITSLWKENLGVLVEVDFEDEIIAANGFLDEGIASLFADFEAHFIYNNLLLININQDDLKEINHCKWFHLGKDLKG